MNKENISVKERQKLSKDALFALFQNPFCIVHKKHSLDIYKGYMEKHDLISDLPLLTHAGANYISMLPFCQIKERGFETHDDGEKILTLRITESICADLEHFKSVVPEVVLELEGAIQSNLTDKEFENIIEKVVENEIKNGEGSNFLMSRKFFGKIKDFKYETTLSILRRLIENEAGSYWNFIFYTGEDIFVGASPERHIAIHGASAVMNPISGTLPKSVENFEEKLEEFVSDPKEINELFQVLDEELKVICKLCPQGGKVVGPFLKEMGTLIHTEYLLEGEGKTNIWRALRESLYAATMVGSPLQNAARIVKKYEGLSRRYYSSVLCLFGKDEDGQEYLDNTITIRTIEIKRTGDFVIQSGNSIVRDSVPADETKELKAKAQGLINAMLNKKKVEFNSVKIGKSVLDKLVARNEFLSKFWLKIYDKEHIQKKSVTIDLIDNEDDFIYMINHMLNYMGYTTNVYKYYDYTFNPEVDMVIIGPGPGDPGNMNHDKMVRLYEIADELLRKNVKILGVCLGHQILSKSLGYELMRAKIPFQGLQKEIDLFGNIQNVGFYNSYFALDNEKINSDLNVKVSKNGDGKIYALRGENFTSYQFHFESVLTQNGLEILNEALGYLLSRKAVSSLVV